MHEDEGPLAKDVFREGRICTTVHVFWQDDIEARHLQPPAIIGIGYLHGGHDKHGAKDRDSEPQQAAETCARSKRGGWN